MELSGGIAVGVIVVGFALFSRKLEHSIITAPMVFVAVGCALGPAAFGLVEMDMATDAVHLFAEITLVLVLFADASRIDVRALWRAFGLPLRLLTIALPLTLVSGAGLATLLFPHLDWAEAALLAAILAPTDAALGQAVVSDVSVPARVRQTLNVESGLNDGIVLPAVLVFAAAAQMLHAPDLTGFGADTARQLVLGPVVGLAVGWLGGQALMWARTSERMSPRFERIAALALAILAFLAAEAVHGNGFIAAFVGGLTLGNTARGMCESVHDFLDTEGELLILVTFLLFGAVLVAPAMPLWNAETWIYAVASLTVIRMVPTALSLVGAGLKPWSPVFIGWFGPRGLASILFVLLILEEAEISHAEEILAVVVATVLISVFVHGMSAFPLARVYGRYIRATRHAEADEHGPAPDLPTRRRATRTPAGRGVAA